MSVAELPPLIALAAIGALILILAAYKATLGRLVDWFIGVAETATVGVGGVYTVHVLRWAVGPLQSFQNKVYHSLADLIDAEKAVWNKFWSWNAYAWSELSGAVADLGHGAEAALHTLRHSILPAVVGAYTNPLGTILYPLVKRVAALAQQLAHQGVHVSKVVEHTVTQTVTRVEHVTKVVYRDVPVATAKAVTVPWGAIRGAEREASAANKWIRANAKKLTAAGIVGLTVAALGRLGLGWTRCSNVGKLGRSVCGMDSGLLESLLASGLVIFGTLSLVELAETMLAGMEEMTSGVLGGWRETSKVEPLKFTGYTGTLG